MRDTQEVQAAVCRMVKALGERVAMEDPEALWHLEKVDQALHLARETAIDGLREHGATDVQIGEVLGMSRQAVQQMWPRRRRVVGAGARYLTR